MRHSLTRFIFALAAMLLTANAWSAPVSISATDSGWTNTAGGSPIGENYLVGTLVTGLSEPLTFRNWFVFDLSGLSGTVVSATLHLYNTIEGLDCCDGYQSPDSTETFELFSYESSIADLIAESGSFDDLGDGSSYGTVTVSSADNGQLVSIELNSAAINDINNTTGLFALGGVLNSLSGQSDLDEYLFAGTNENPIRELELTTIPLPAPLLLLLSACGFLGWFTRK